MKQYFTNEVQGSPEGTIKAKTRDFHLFLGFYAQEVGTDHVDAWTPTVSKEFIKHLRSIVSEHTGKAYAPTTINRVIATIKHFGGKYLHKQHRPLLAGHPFQGVSDLDIPNPAWSGLSSRDIMRLKSAVDQRLAICKRKDQNPLLEATVFYTLLYTGLRESELCGLDLHQYHHKGFHSVVRKNNRIDNKVPVPSEARERIDQYLAHDYSKEKALFIGRFGDRLKTVDVRKICIRIAQQANAHLKKDEQIKLSPHMLRHTFLKKMADKHGVHYAQDFSGNKTMGIIFRYTQPSEEERSESVEGLF